MTAQAALKQPGATIRASKHSEPATQEKLIQADKSEPTGIRMTCEWGQDAAWAPVTSPARRAVMVATSTSALAARAAGWSRPSGALRQIPSGVRRGRTAPSGGVVVWCHWSAHVAGHRRWRAVIASSINSTMSAMAMVIRPMRIMACSLR